MVYPSVHQTKGAATATASHSHYKSSSRRNNGDDRSTTSSNESYPMRRDRASPRLEGLHLASHVQHPLQQQASQRRQIMRHDTALGGGGDGDGAGGSSTTGGSSRHGQFPTLGGAGGGGGASTLQGGEARYDDDGLSMESQNGTGRNVSYLPSMDRGGGLYPGSAPSAFYRESFPVAPGGIANDGGSGSGGGGNGRSIMASPMLAGASPMQNGFAGGDRENGHHNDDHPLGGSGAGGGTGSASNANTSPLMTGLTFSLDLAGYTTTGGGLRSFRVSGGNMSEGAGSVHGSDFVGFDSALSDSGVMSSQGGGDGGRFGGGFDELGLSPLSMHGSVGGMEASSLPRHLEIGPSSFGNSCIVGSAPAGTSSLFSFNNHGQGGGGGGGGGGDHDDGIVEVRVCSTFAVARLLLLVRSCFLRGTYSSA